MAIVAWPILTDSFPARLAETPPPDPGIDQLPEGLYLGRGILRPLRRDQKQDFANSSGQRLISSCLGQLLATQCESEYASGELPWRTEFGSKLYLLRLRLNSVALKEQARRFVADAVQRWEPRVRVTEVDVQRASTEAGNLDVLLIKMKYKFVGQNTANNAALFEGEVSIPYRV